MKISFVENKRFMDKHSYTMTLEIEGREYKKLISCTDPLVYTGSVISRSLYKAAIEACRDAVYDALLTGREHE